MEDVDLSVDIAGIALKNPLVLSEGPLSGSADLIRRATEFSIGAVVTKSIRNEPAVSPARYMIRSGKGLINADWSDLGFKQWMKELETLDIKVPLIVNVATNHVTPAQAAEYASILQHHGADMVTFSDYEPENLVSAVRMARAKVGVPIMVKLPPFRKDIGKLSRKLEDAGVNCIAAMDAVGPAMDIDIYTRAPVIGNKEGFGYLSGEPIFPLTLAYIAEICRNVNVPVLGVGGVTTWKDAVKLIMAGATAVGISGGAILHGLEVFNKIESSMKEWMHNEHIFRLDEIRGAVKDHKAVEEYDWVPVVNETCNGCRLCIRSCFTQAITIEEGKAFINPNMCVGCGVCMTTCPRNSIIRC
jgi:dihydroorotate dehydrogenase subfamily 1